VSRLEAAFDRLRDRGETGVIPYLMVGAPSVEATLEIAPALVAGGADALELGIPFSDPLADGVTIQRAGAQALKNGVTLDSCLEVCRELRRRGIAVPFVFMGYYNPFLAYGLERFAMAAAEAGADGVIVPDLPPEEAGPLLKACRKHHLDLVFLLAPTSPKERILKAARCGSGFLYCVSLTGVTGAREHLGPNTIAFLKQVRASAQLPLAVGFGISRREHVRAVAPYADAAVVGSALIDLIEQAPPAERAARARAFIEALKGHHGE
jgi:tryptophan synthase alpha chain